ncbi:MAG TPA: preprotein translocase subunit SecE [Clostridia bacterium]|nr:preprotein translocase subunit SecE [Clostridia bacterium]
MEAKSKALTGKVLSARISKFFREVRAEMRKVIWPTRRETMIYTSIVVLSIVAVGAAVWAIDTVFALGIGLILR